MDGIRWISSYLKSGSTWVRMALSAYLADGLLDINRPLGCYGDNNVAAHTRVLGRNLSGITPYEQMAARQVVLLDLMDRAELPLPPILKTHNANLVMDGLPLIPWPLTDAAVYLVRDPRDVVISFADHVGQSIDETIEWMNQPQANSRNGHLVHWLGTWSEHVQTWAREGLPVKVVRYEDLLDHPERWMREIFEHLGVPGVTNVRVERAVAAASFDRLQAQEQENGFSERSAKSERFFRIGRSGQWVDVLTDRQARRIERDHGEVMERIGYALEYRSAA